MRNILIILTLFATIFYSCSSSNEVVQSKAKKTSKVKSLSEKERMQYDFVFFNAIKERILGNYELSAQLFNKATSINPNEGAAYFELAKIYDFNKAPKLALEAISKAVSIDPENYYYRELYAHTLQRTENIEEAINQYKILLTKNPHKTELYFGLARMQVYVGKYKEALKNFNIIEEKNGVVEDISVQKEKIYLKLGDVEKAADELKKLINEYPSETRFLALLAELYSANEFNEKALVVYHQILEKDSTSAYAHMALHEYYSKNGEDEKAFKEIKAAFKDSEFDIDAKVQILLSYYSSSNTKPQLKKEAYELSKILIETHPKNAKSYTIFADFLYRDKKLESAKENFLKAIEYDNSKFAIWSQVMFIESELQDIDGMLRDSKAAIELFPNQPIFYFFYGSANIQKKQYKEAVEYLNIGKDFVIDNPPLLAQFYASLGDGQHQLKEYKKSDAAYEKALEIEPRNIYVLNNYGYYLSLREENLDRAEEVSALCNDIEPDQFNYQDTYAWILYKQKKYIQAKEWLEKSIKNGGDKNPVILEHLGDVVFKLNNPEEALKYWIKAKDLGKGTDLLEKKIATKTLHE